MQEMTLYLFPQNRFTFHAYYSKPIKWQVQNRHNKLKSKNCKHVLSLENCLWEFGSELHVLKIKHS